MYVQYSLVQCFSSLLSQVDCSVKSPPDLPLTVSTGLVSQDPAVDQEVPGADLHGGDDGDTGGELLLPAAAALPPAPLRHQSAPPLQRHPAHGPLPLPALLLPLLLPDIARLSSHCIVFMA